MTLLTVPNISEGRDAKLLKRLERAAQRGSALLLDVHTDAVHNRSVFTMSGSADQLIEGCVALAATAVGGIDLTLHEGVHPRLGAMDVCPFVAHDDSMEAAVAAARKAADELARTLELPVYLYGAAATRGATVELPDLRRGGLEALRRRAATALPPDAGPTDIDPRRGVVCVGARGPLIAFNVWLRGDLPNARAIAGEVRSDAVRALGLRISETEVQVSMNLIDPAQVGIDQAFARVADRAEQRGMTVTATELVGLVAERFLPGPDATVTRLLKQPGHSLEASLKQRS